MSLKFKKERMDQLITNIMSSGLHYIDHFTVTENRIYTLHLYADIETIYDTYWSQRTLHDCMYKVLHEEIITNRDYRQVVVKLTENEYDITLAYMVAFMKHMHPGAFKMMLHYNPEQIGKLEKSVGEGMIDFILTVADYTTLLDEADYKHQLVFSTHSLIFYDNQERENSIIHCFAERSCSSLMNSLKVQAINVETELTREREEQRNEVNVYHTGSRARLYFDTYPNF